MTIVESTYKGKKLDDITIARYLVIGFTGQLRHWWDNYLSSNDQRYIIENRDEQGESTAVDTLVFTITKHFVGNPAMFQDKASEFFKTLDAESLDNLDIIKMFSPQMS